MIQINTDYNCNLIINSDVKYPINGVTYGESKSLYIIKLNTTEKSLIVHYKYIDHVEENTNSDKYVFIRDYITYSQIYNLDDNYSDPQGETYDENDEESQIESLMKSTSVGGYYTIYHIILPTSVKDNSYLESENNTSNSSIDELLDPEDCDNIELPSLSDYDKDDSRIFYYIDNEQIKKVVNNEVLDVSLLEIISDMNLNSTNIYREEKNFFSICQLKRCFLKLNLKLLNSNIFDKCFNFKYDKELTYKRDLVWAALNTIQYLVDFGKLVEALRLLERIGGCNGLCAPEDTLIHTNCGCPS